MADIAMKGERRWPMALAALAAGVLRALLPPELRFGDSRVTLLVLVAILIIALAVGDPGRIDRQRAWLRVLTGLLIALITLANVASAVRLVVSIIEVQPFTEDARVLLGAGGAIWLTNVIAFGLWFWDLDRGGAAERAAAGSSRTPAFIFPEMSNPAHVPAGWAPAFIDYLHLSFNVSTAFSATDVSAVKPWAKLMMIAEAALSMTIAVLVVARAVNILKA